jgi:hypothetical protein
VKAAIPNESQALPARVADWFDDPTSSVPWVRRLLLALVFVQAMAFLARGADGPTDPYFKGPVSVTVAPPASPVSAPAGLPGG